MEFKLLTHPSEISFSSTFDRAGKLRRDRGHYFLDLEPANPADAREFLVLYLKKNAISMDGHKPKELAAFNPVFNEPETVALLEELTKISSRLPELDEAADTAAAEAEIMKVALKENADLAAVPAMLNEQRKKRDQAEEAAVLRDTAEHRIEKLEGQIKDMLRARRKRIADEGKARLHVAAETINQKIGEAYAEFWKVADGLFIKIHENDADVFPAQVEFHSPAMNIADGAGLKTFKMHPVICVNPSGHLWFDLKQAVRDGKGNK